MGIEQPPVSQVEFLALRLEDASPHPGWCLSAATELRRQHAEIERLTRYLVSIRDTGMSATEAAEHAADALTDARPGVTIGLHDEHAVRRLLAAERASRQAAQIENEALKAECLRLQTKADQSAGLARRMRPVLAAAVALVCAPAWAGISDEDVALERALRDAGMLTPNVGAKRAAEGGPLERPVVRL